MRLFLWLRAFIMKISCPPGTACRNSCGAADPLPLKDSGSLSLFLTLRSFDIFFSESFLKVEWHLSLLAAVITRASSSSFPHERLASTKGLYQSIKESEWVKEKQKLAHFSVKSVNFCFYHLDLLAVTLIIQNPSQMFCSQVFTAFRSCN